LRQKGTYAPPQDKARGLNIHDGEWALAPYDQNKLFNHKLSIAKPLKHVNIIQRHLLTREHTYDIFINIAINHGYKPRLLRAKTN
jgi:hypothetical protein